MIKVAILGASGYTGIELLRLLAPHPSVKVGFASSRQYAQRPVSEVFPAFSGFYDGLVFRDPEEFKRIKVDVAFCALPHGASHEVVGPLLTTGVIAIDLSADFRLKDEKVYKRWYGDHKAGDLLRKAVYGLPELYRDQIRKARLIANPGCYPTSAILALAPALKRGIIDPGSIIVDSKSGVSGAGRSSSPDFSFAEVNQGFKAYKVGCHRHTPEIEQEMSAIAGKKTTITFTPHLLPVSRGILTTAYAGLKKAVTTDDLRALYAAFYEKEPFVRVLPTGAFPDISQVRCANFCDIGVHVDEAAKRLIVVSVIDNLVKGASGQAIQNMNIALGLEETTGLMALPIQV
ncbi:MAG: N-acetyl-gamma-glutamyl-phosphate reductase [Deltaproteobacteria bacterium]|nr:N-acetyl-gamma-glutamyl-phosphate reductase [Deltaproteobacteria bacterium]